MKYEALNLLDLLKEKNIIYQLFEHEPFFTVEESSKLKIDLNMQGAHTKNLFLRDKKRINPFFDASKTSLSSGIGFFLIILIFFK